MANLPTVSGDEGIWGAILNEFLSVAHNADGTLIVDKTTVGLSNVDDTSDASKPVSTAQAAAIALKANAASPAITGTITISADVNLYRSAANVLKTDDAFVAVGAINSGSYVYAGSALFTYNGTVNQCQVGFIFGGPSAPASGTGAPGIEFGQAGDTNLYRVSANTLKTDDAFCIRGGVGFYNTTPAAQPTVTGSRAGNAALASLLTGLAGLGLITDSTTA